MLAAAALPTGVGSGMAGAGSGLVEGRQLRTYMHTGNRVPALWTPLAPALLVRDPLVRLNPV